jgi:hypothetical protein
MQIGARVAGGDIAPVIFLRDPPSCSMIDRIRLAAEAVLSYRRGTRTCVMCGRRINPNEPNPYFGHTSAHRGCAIYAANSSRGGELVSRGNCERSIGAA